MMLTDACLCIRVTTVVSHRYGFNPGSQLAIAGFTNSAVVSRVAVTTTLSAGAGGVSMLLFKYWRTGECGA